MIPKSTCYVVTLNNEVIFTGNKPEAKRYFKQLLKQGAKVRWYFSTGHKIGDIIEA